MKPFFTEVDCTELSHGTQSSEFIRLSDANAKVEPLLTLLREAQPYLSDSSTDLYERIDEVLGEKND